MIVFLLSQFGEFLIEHWELIAFLATGAAAILFATLHFRNWEKAKINQTHIETIDALNGLIAARDKELDSLEQQLQEANEAYSELETERDQNAKDLDDIRSEYKVISSIKIAELIAEHKTKETHAVEIELLESTCRILRRQLQAFEIDKSIEPNQ